MVDKDDDDVQDAVWRIKETAREAVERAHSAINDAWSEVQALIDENDEEGAVQDAVEELSIAVAGLEAAADEVERALRAVSRIGVKAAEADEGEAEDENDENDEEDA